MRAEQVTDRARDELSHSWLHARDAFKSLAREIFRNHLLDQELVVLSRAWLSDASVSDQSDVRQALVQKLTPVFLGFQGIGVVDLRIESRSGRHEPLSARTALQYSSNRPDDDRIQALEYRFDLRHQQEHFGSLVVAIDREQIERIMHLDHPQLAMGFHRRGEPLRLAFAQRDLDAVPAGLLERLDALDPLESATVRRLEWAGQQWLLTSVDGSAPLPPLVDLVSLQRSELLEALEQEYALKETLSFALLSLLLLGALWWEWRRQRREREREAYRELAQEHAETLVRQERLMMSQARTAVLGEMLAAIAHQWRQPINALGLWLQNVEDLHEMQALDDDTLCESIQGCREQLQFMNATIDDFRSFLRPMDSSQDFDVHVAIAESLRLFAPRLRGHAIQVAFRCQGSNAQSTPRTCWQEPVCVDVATVNPDCSQAQVCSTGSLRACGCINDFKHVLLVLVNNARDAIVDARGSAGGTIGIETAVLDDQVLLDVTDDGGGIADEHMVRLFEPHFSTKGEAGTGIGLCVARMLVEKRLQGAIEVQNIAEGARFRLRLPRSGTVPCASGADQQGNSG